MIEAIIYTVLTFAIFAGGLALMIVYGVGRRK